MHAHRNLDEYIIRIFRNWKFAGHFFGPRNQEICPKFATKTKIRESESFHVLCLTLALCRQVNGEDLRDASHERAIQVLRETPSSVCMLVFRDESVLRDEDIYDVFAVELMKKPGRGLGISIVGRRNDTGIFISDVVSHTSRLGGVFVSKLESNQLHQHRR